MLEKNALHSAIAFWFNVLQLYLAHCLLSSQNYKGCTNVHKGCIFLEQTIYNLQSFTNMELRALWRDFPWDFLFWGASCLFRSLFLALSHLISAMLGKMSRRTSSAYVSWPQRNLQIGNRSQPFLLQKSSSTFNQLIGAMLVSGMVIIPFSIHISLSLCPCIEARCWAVVVHFH